jgi:hypothetical protein
MDNSLATACLSPSELASQWYVELALGWLGKSQHIGVMKRVEWATDAFLVFAFGKSGHLLRR